MTDSGLEEGRYDATRFGVYLGSGEGQQDFNSFSRMMAQALTGESLDVGAFAREGLETLHPMSELEQEPHMPAAHMASAVSMAARAMSMPGISLPISVTTACAISALPLR